MVKHICQKSSMECLTCISLQPCISFQRIFTNAFNYFKIFFYSNINSRSKWRKVAKNKKKSGYMYFNYKTNQIVLIIMLIKQNQSYLVLIFMNAKLFLYYSLCFFVFSKLLYMICDIFLDQHKGDRMWLPM